MSGARVRTKELLKILVVCHNHGNTQVKFVTRRRRGHKAIETTWPYLLAKKPEFFLSFSKRENGICWILVIHLNFRGKRSWMDGSAQIQFKKIIYPRDFCRITSNKQTNKTTQKYFFQSCRCRRGSGIISNVYNSGERRKNAILSILIILIILSILSSFNCNFVQSQMEFLARPPQGRARGAPCPPPGPPSSW